MTVAVDLRDVPPGELVGPGVYRMGARAYHSDPALEPSLSAGIACRLLAETPMAARAEHPRLNGKGYVPELQATKVNVGSLVHSLLLGHGDEFAFLPSKIENYLTKEAKELRDGAIAEGKVPILAKDATRGEIIAEKLLARLRAIVPGALVDGAAEVTMIWRDEHGCFCRSRVDWWGPEPHDIIDIKTTTGGLDDETLGRRIKSELDVRAGHYIRGLRSLLPDLRQPIRYRLVFVQQEEPYDLRVVQLDSQGLAIGQEKAAYAAAIFAHCLRERNWPGWPPEETTIEYPSYAATHWEHRRTYDLMLTTLGVRPAYHSLFAPPPRQPAAPSWDLSE